MFEWVGWLATATFASSYFFRRPAPLRRIQALAAVFVNQLRRHHSRASRDCRECGGGRGGRVLVFPCGPILRLMAKRYT